MGEKYNGVVGKLGPAEKAAVDGLIALLSEVCDYPLDGPDNKRILVHGRFVRCLDADEPGDAPFPLWQLCEVDFAYGQAGTSGSGGSSVMACSLDALGLLRACEEYLREFHTLPHCPSGWDSAVDEKADAEWRLRQVWAATETS